MSKSYFSSSPLASRRFIPGTQPSASTLELMRTMLSGMHGNKGITIRLEPDGIVVEGSSQQTDPFPWKAEIITSEENDIVRLHPGARHVVGSGGEWVNPPTGDYFEWPFAGGDKVVWMSYNFTPEDEHSAWTGPEYGTPPAETPTLHVRIIASITADKHVMQNQFGAIIIWNSDDLPAGEDNRDIMRWAEDEQRWVFFPYSQPALSEGEIPVLSATGNTLVWGRTTGAIDEENIPDDDDADCDQNTHPATANSKIQQEDAHPAFGTSLFGIDMSMPGGPGPHGTGTSGTGTVDPNYHPSHDDCYTTVPPTETTP